MCDYVTKHVVLTLKAASQFDAVSAILGVQCKCTVCVGLGLVVCVFLHQLCSQIVVDKSDTSNKIISFTHSHH